MDGWQPCRFEGFDFDITGSMQAAGRIVPLADVECGYNVECPEGCGLSGNILMFSDPEAGLCGLNDGFQDSYATSPAFSIGGFENGDIDGQGGRLVRFRHLPGRRRWLVLDRLDDLLGVQSVQHELLPVHPDRWRSRCWQAVELVTYRLPDL